MPKSNSPWRCSICGQRAESMALVREHKKAKHGDNQVTTDVKKKSKKKPKTISPQAAPPKESPIKVEVVTIEVKTPKKFVQENLKDSKLFSIVEETARQFVLSIPENNITELKNIAKKDGDASAMAFHRALKQILR